MKSIFVESSIFEKHRTEYLSDDDYQLFQCALLAEPSKGDTRFWWVTKSSSRGKKEGEAWWCKSDLLPL